MNSNKVHAVIDKSKFELQRIPNVIGDHEKRNDLILCRSKNEKFDLMKKTVIFFGGDCQNYPEIMKEHPKNILYLPWNLENTARILAGRFPDSLIMVVKAKEMLPHNLRSVYLNFVEFDQDGLPTMFTKKAALTHLSKLHAKALKEYIKQSSCDSDDGNQVCSDSLHEVTIVGFSKGCVPLNQIMYEIAAENLPPETAAFASQIKAVYWLDGGHGGRKDAYITEDSVLQSIVSTNIQLFVHVTPYEVKDENRPCIGEEKDKFIQILKSLNADLVEKEHHFDQPGSIDLHFAFLTEF